MALLPFRVILTCPVLGSLVLRDERKSSIAPATTARFCGVLGYDIPFDRMALLACLLDIVGFMVEYFLAIQYILLRDFLRLEVEDLRLDPVTLPRLGILRICPLESTNFTIRKSLEKSSLVTLNSGLLGMVSLHKILRSHLPKQNLGGRFSGPVGHVCGRHESTYCGPVTSVPAMMAACGFPGAATVCIGLFSATPPIALVRIGW